MYILIIRRRLIIIILQDLVFTGYSIYPHPDIVLFAYLDSFSFFLI